MNPALSLTNLVGLDGFPRKGKARERRERDSFIV
jgi:hypothetical protein